jgi:hypothetical protein
MADSQAKQDKVVKLTNTTRNIVVSGQVRIAPGQTLEIPESKISEGLKRLIGAGLKKAE